jgi:hypothetical protein
MRKFIALLILAFTPICVLGQDIEVKKENRVKNQTGIQCVWASLETLARHHGYTQLYKVTEYKKGVAYYQDAFTEMCRVGGVDFVGTQGPIFTPIEEGIQAGSPVAVCIVSGPRMKHCLVCCGVNKKAGTMTVIDNLGDMKEQVWKIDDFMKVYSGECFYLKKKK